MMKLSVTTVVDSQFNCEMLCSNMVMAYDNMPYAELVVVGCWLKALAAIHQAHHWQASADPFYGDHLLYQRLYDSANDEVDRVAEKAVGVGCSELVTPITMSSCVDSIIKAIYFVRPGIPNPTDLAARSLNTERNLLSALKYLSTNLEQKNLLTKGVDNLIADLCDAHEGSIYLLKQRCSQ